LDRIYQGGAAFCIHNAATGRELTMPHRAQVADKKRRVVIVGAGPAGLEAARVAAERGHDVLVFEAASQPGGQIRLAALSPRRRELLGIIDWRMAQCASNGVEFRFESLAEVDAIVREKPDVVIIATGGLPDTEILSSGNELLTSTWDIVAGNVKPASNVLLFDDAGDHAGLQAAEIIAATGARLEIMTPDRSFAPDVMAMNLVPYLRALQRPNVTFTVTYRLQQVTRGDQDALRAQIGSDYGIPAQHRSVDQVVVNHGTLPLESLYFELTPISRNHGEVNYSKLLAGQAQSSGLRPEAAFDLYRIGDAVASRNIHAAVYDALRLVKDI
jgi:NADPH-dependent 2,4-dienoyl-CoA reductase/sulfur reductase-like enzyme